ncbi:exodeoxyribonuclease VII small subunit [Chloroflexota bacterium]
MSDEVQSAALAIDDLPFEQAFRELDEIVQRLEAGELALDEALALYEQGMRLARHCNDALDAAELQVQQLAVAGEQQQLGMFFEGEGA